GDAADHLARVQERVDDAAAVVRGDYALDDHLAGVALDAELDRLRAAGADRAVLRVVAALGDGAALPLRGARRFVDCGAESRERGAAGARRAVQAGRGVAELDLHRVERNGKRLGGDLRKRGARAGADVLHADDHARLAATKFHPGLRRRPAAAGGPVVRGEAEARALSLPLDHLRGARDAAAQALGRGERLAFALIGGGVVAQAKVDRVHVEALG